MAPLELEGDTLGKKHQNFNELVNNTPKNYTLQAPFADDDINNLLNIDIANKNHNVDYILEILKSEDELYVSKAIKRSSWLITDTQYAHIINPEYLYTELYPQVTLKAFKKFMLHIRLHLRDEKRVEAFYSYIKDKEDAKTAYKWLQHCSVPFIEAEILKIERGRHSIPQHLVIRLFEKSFSIFETHYKQNGWLMKESVMLLRNHTLKCLDFIESLKDTYYIDISAKYTKMLMERFPQRILDKFEFYGRYLDTATFAKHLKKSENIAEFLLKYSNNEKFKWLFKYNKIQHFIKLMPKESRFEFVQKVYIDKDLPPVNNETQMSDCSDEDMCCDDMCEEAGNNISTNTNIYQWYKFAPFDLAFTDLKKLIRTESSSDQRTAILQVLLFCAGRNMQHNKAVLQYYCDKHINEPFKFKTKFVNIFLSKVDTHSLDEETWTILSQLFHSMEVFIESKNNVQPCLQAIIVRNTIKNIPIPDIVEKKFTFDTLKPFEKKLKKQVEKEAVFKYLQNFIIKKYNEQNLTIESEFISAVECCEDHLKLIKVWDKELLDCPIALERIKELIYIKKEKQWNKDLASLYKIKKSWRKTLFEVSIATMQNESVCMNALKHDPVLLSRNKDYIIVMCSNDALSFRNELRKMRIYWPRTLAEEWKSMYSNRLNDPKGHKALIDGLCVLLSQEQMKELLQNYAPSDTKIDWNNTDQQKLSLCKQIAKSMHKARPLPAFDGILPYAKGDYLQYVVPSLNSLLTQLSPMKSRLYIPTLLNSPVSLQKFGVRCAFSKLTYEQLKPMLFELWKTTKNSSIRTILFTHTYEMLRKESNDSRAKDMWELLSLFIDNLTSNENKLIYKKLGVFTDLPVNIKPLFFMKSYTFLISLPAKCDCADSLSCMQERTDDIMEFLDDNFVVNVMLKKLFESLPKEKQIYDEAVVLVTFILASKDEETQMKRYEKSLGVLLNKYLPVWDTTNDGAPRVKKHIQYILQKLADHQTYVYKKRFQAPLKVFEQLKLKLENSLDHRKNYILLTTWKLIVCFMKTLVNTDVLNECYKIEAEVNDRAEDEKTKRYSAIFKQITPLFSQMCLQNLKADLDRFGRSIYTLFAGAFRQLFDEYASQSMSRFEDLFEYVLWILRNDQDKEVWLMIHEFLKRKMHFIYNDEHKRKFGVVRELVMAHPCEEVKMHYYDLFSEYSLSSQ